MNVLSVSATGFRCYEELDWTIPQGASALIGDNATGKTSRLMAIETGLFAERGELGSDGILKSGCDSCMVTVEVEHEGSVYRVRRAFNKGRTTCDFERANAVRVNDGRSVLDDSIPTTEAWTPLTLASIAETDALIVQTLGMNRAIFRAVVILGQGALALASKSLTPKQRMDMFIALVRLDIYPRLAKAAHDQLAVVNAEHAVAYQRHTDALEQAAGKDEHARLSAEHDQAAREAQEKLAAAQALQETLRDQFTTARDLTQAVETARAAVTVAEGEHRRLNDVTVAAEDARKALAALGPGAERLEALASRIPGLEGIERELREQDETYKRRLAEWQAAVRESEDAEQRLVDLDRRAVTLTNESQALFQKADRALEHLGEPCDRCHRPLGAEDAERAAESYRAEAREKTNEAVRLVAAYSTIVIPLVGEPPTDRPSSEALTGAEQNLRAARSAERDLATLTERRNTLLQKIAQADDSSFLAEMKDAVAAVEAAREALRAAQAAAPDPTAVQQIKMDGLAASAAANEAQQALTHATSEKARADERLAVATAAEERATTLAAGLAALTEQAATLEHAKTCLGTYAPSIVIENTVPRIEADFADNINQLGGPTAGTRVEFRTQKENKSGTVADRLDVVFVTADGHDRLYDDWSTGERLRLSLALARAIVPNLDLLIIDDPPGLDAEGKAAMVDTIHALVHQGAVTSVVVVSQEAELRDSFEQVLELETRGGRSVVAGARELEGASA